MKNVFEKNGKKRNKSLAIFWSNGINVSLLNLYTTKTYHEKLKQNKSPLLFLDRSYSISIGCIDGKNYNSVPSQPSRSAREAYIGKIKEGSQRNSTENLHLQKNKKQSAKKTNFRVKKLAGIKFTKIENLQRYRKKWNFQFKGSVDKPPTQNLPQVESWLASQKNFSDPGSDGQRVPLKKELTKDEVSPRRPNLPAKTSLNLKKELAQDNYLPSLPLLNDWVIIREKSVDQVNFVVIPSPGKKFTKRKHVSEINSRLATQKKSTKPVNFTVKKSVYKNFPKGKSLKKNKKENILKGEGLTDKSLTNSQSFPRVHFWLTTGEPLADQSNVGVLSFLEKKLHQRKSLQGNKKRYKLIVKRLAGKEFSKAQPIKKKRKKSNFPLKKSADNNSTKSFDIEQQGHHYKFYVRFTNLLMLDGKKSKALSTLSKSLKLFKKYVKNLSCNDQCMQNSVNTKTNNSTLYYLHQAVGNVKPCLEVRKKKISGIMRQIPAVPSLKRQETLGIRWIIESARKKKNYKPFHQCLAEELLNAFQKQGEAYKRKQALHKTAEANRIYIRHRWW